MLEIGKVIQQCLQNLLKLRASLAAIVAVLNDDNLGAIAAAFVGITDVQSADIERDRHFAKQFG